MNLYERACICADSGRQFLIRLFCTYSESDPPLYDYVLQVDMFNMETVRIFSLLIDL